MFTASVPNGNGRASPAGHRAIDQETQHRPDAAEQHDADPDQSRRCCGGGHPRTRTRRTNAVARCTASNPSAMLVDGVADGQAPVAVFDHLQRLDLHRRESG